MRIDLHMHSNLSDGKLPPEDLLRSCVSAGLDVVAITDHDIAPRMAAGRHRLMGRNVFCVHGAEVSAMHRGVELHLLVFFPGQMPEEFRQFLVGRAKERADRYSQAIASMALSGVQTPSSADCAGERALTRLHLARALVEAGHVEDVRDAFQQWLGVEHGHVPQLQLQSEELIRKAHAMGGVVSWAHPDPEQLQEWCGELAEMGLDAIEVGRPGGGKASRNTSIRIAHRHRLLVSGGSDYHGWMGAPLGAFSFPLRLAKPLFRRLGVPTSGPN